MGSSIPFHLIIVSCVASPWVLARLWADIAQGMLQGGEYGYVEGSRIAIRF